MNNHNRVKQISDPLMSKGILASFRIIKTNFISIVQSNKQPYDKTNLIYKMTQFHSTYLGYSAILRGVQKILTGIKFISDGFLLN
jgi:hypothetical protein